MCLVRFPFVLNEKLQYLHVKGLTFVCVRICFFSIEGWTKDISVKDKQIDTMLGIGNFIRITVDILLLCLPFCI